MNINRSEGVFVTDGFWRKSIAAVRALGKSGVRVVAGEYTPLAPALFSRFASARVVYPSISRGAFTFVKTLINLTKRHMCRVLFPMEESTLILVRSYPELIPEDIIIPFPDLETLLIARDKGRVIQLANELGIPAPKSVIARKDNSEEAVLTAKNFDFPLIIKPCIGSGSVGLCRIPNWDNLVSQIRLAVDNHGPCLIQEAIPKEGEGLGVSLLIGYNGEVMARFTHRRLREFPANGGPSTLRESTACPEAEEYAERLLAGLNWKGGVAMVEFKKDTRSGKYSLMEINPRFWGSLALAVAAGVNFPFLLYKMALGIKFDPVTTYPLGVKCRWLLPGDIMHFLTSSTPWREFFPLSAPDLHYDIVSAKDPLPTLGTILSFFSFIFDSRLRHFMTR